MTGIDNPNLFKIGQIRPETKIHIHLTFQHSFLHGQQIVNTFRFWWGLFYTFTNDACTILLISTDIPGSCCCVLMNFKVDKNWTMKYAL